MVDPNLENKDGSTSYGTLFYQCLTDYYTEHGYEPKPNMNLMLSTCKVEIDIHKPSIDILQNGSVSTPIYSYFIRCHDKMKLQDDQLILNNEHIQ